MPLMQISALLPNTVLSQDIFENPNSKMPLLKKGTVVSAEYLYGLKRRGISHISVKEAMFTNEDGFVINSKKRDDSLKGMPFEKSRAAVPPKLRKELTAGLCNLHLAIGGKDKDEVVNSINQLADLIADVVEFLSEDPTAPLNITSLQSDHEFVYAHCVSVAVLSLAIGQSMGLSTYELMQLGRCAILHDLGKLMIPAEILLKTEELTLEERMKLRTHCELGYDCLKMWNVCTENERLAIFSHHERLDGSGYPEGLTSEKIPMWGKIVAVAEVYDAMTNPHPPAKAESPTMTREYLIAHANKYFDPKVVLALHKRVEFYPLGCFVEISSGHYALVTSSKNRLRPVVKVMGLNNEIDLKESRNSDITINRIVSYKEALKRN